jgi:hypothetical protein
MQIDSVAAVAPPAESVRPVTAPQANAPGQPPAIASVPPLTGGGPSVRAFGGRPGGGHVGDMNSRRPPIAAQHQVPRATGGGGTAPGQTAGRSPMMPMGPTGQQTSATGHSAGAGARGAVGPVGPTGQQGAAGRAAGAGGGRAPIGPMGQTTPVAGGQVAGRAGSPAIGGAPTSRGVVGGAQSPTPPGGRGTRPVQAGAPASGGVVGGRPAVTSNAPNGKGVPRGTVIGGDIADRRTAAEQPGRRGVVGAQAVPATSTGTSGARLAGRERPQTAPGGVSGAPRETGGRDRRGSGGDRREAPSTTDRRQERG